MYAFIYLIEICISSKFIEGKGLVTIAIGGWGGRKGEYFPDGHLIWLTYATSLLKWRREFAIFY